MTGGDCRDDVKFEATERACAVRCDALRMLSSAATVCNRLWWKMWHRVVDICGACMCVYVVGGLTCQCVCSMRVAFLAFGGKAYV